MTTPAPSWAIRARSALTTIEDGKADAEVGAVRHFAMHHPRDAGGGGARALARAIRAERLRGLARRTAPL
ncbi:MAG: hypothetical protein ACM3II_00040, partial [Rhodospirillaceae bacterium]